MTSSKSDALLRDQLKSDLMTEMEINILPYWAERMTDSEGGFYGRRDGYDRIDFSAPKGVILNARILWSFSAAYRLTHSLWWRALAVRAKNELLNRFYDKEYGGVYWSINRDGSPADTKKQFYAIGFAIYGLSEYARALGDQDVLEIAKQLFYDIETHSRDREHGGYIEALSRSWQPIEDMRLSQKDFNASKTMNTHLHIIESYTNLLRVWRSPELLEATKELLNIFLEKILYADNHLGLFFDNEWHRQDAIISYGHDIEASWLLLETAIVIGDEALLNRTRHVTRKIAEAALQGRCSDGSMIYERHASGSYDNEKHWWVQAELLVGQIYLYCYHNKPEMLEKASQTWKYIREELVDYLDGEWIWSRLPDGSPNRKGDKAGFWKCPYHNTRMCVETVERLRAFDK